MQNNRIYIFKVFFMILMSLIAYQNFQLREFDWDLPGYLGAVYQIEENNPQEIHQKVFSLLKAEVPQEDFEKITNANEYRKGMYADATAFGLQIPYYSVKSAYVLFIFLLYKLGFSAITATLLISAVSFFIAGVLTMEILFFISRRILLSSALALLIFLMPPIGLMAQMATPDILAFSFLLVFFNLFIREKYFVFQFFILLIITLIRPDYIIFAVGFYVFQFILKRERKAILHIGVFLLVYIINSRLHDYPGWESLFYDSFIHRRVNILIEPATVTFTDYFTILIHNIVNFKKVSFLAVLLLSMVLLISKNRYLKYLAVFMFLNIYMKFFLFPAAGDLRFYIPFLVLMFFLVLKANNQLKNNLFKPWVN